MAEVSAVVCLIACMVVVSMEAGWANPRLRLWGKSVASLAMVGFAVAAGATDSPAGGCFLLGLCLSGAGDALIARQGGFARGLTAFLGAHLAYILAFGILGVSIAGIAFAAVVLLPLSIAVWMRISPHSGKLKNQLTAYVFVISVMLLAAFGCAWSDPNASHQLLLFSALGFAVSDLFVAEQRFRTAHWSRVAVGLPLYYLAQLGIGAGAGGL
ncbi:MAG: lysoplasmalogenase [Myxococcota bacterium]|nr:lysoplasmalogenase [Myxococcota bacterium]